ncbi:hypothetical protein X551_02403 [Methylibium sp. T29]|nr:hypothetical protein X551_02403 [Methylibium sp. T29]EWS59084.1 hypothetical protein Y694_03061 [Methylibium sp. T29-B]
MGQISLSDAEYAGKRKKTRREVFLAEMEVMVPWKALLDLMSRTTRRPVASVLPTCWRRCCART